MNALADIWHFPAYNVTNCRRTKGYNEVYRKQNREVGVKAKFDSGIITEMEYNEFRSIVSAAEYEFFMSGFIKRGRCNIQKSI